MHERDVWTGLLALLLTVLFFTTSLGPVTWVLSLAVIGAAWLADRRFRFDGEIAVLVPVGVGIVYLLVFETPPKQMFLNGVVRSGIFALGAVGLTLVYGILNLVNFAHGDLLTAGAYLAWLVATATFGIVPWHIGGTLTAILLVLVLWDRVKADRMRGPDRKVVLASAAVLAGITVLDTVSASVNVTILAGIVLSAAAVALFSVGLDRVLWTRLRAQQANLLTLMIVSIGVAFALRSSLQLAFGGDIRVFFQQAAGQNLTMRYWLGFVGLGDLRITDIDLWIIGTSIVAIVATTLVMGRTRVGKAMRALADNRDLARVAGIDTERVIVYVWVLGGALAGIAGTLLAMETTLHGTLGWRALLPLFAVVILGGVGSVPGALLGGIVIGMAEELSVHWLALAGLDTSYNVAVGFLILIITLIIRPRGIMGVEQA